MAKQMFCTLQEAAERLGVDEQAVKTMASEGKIQQFRDRDQLMFKREEVEQLAEGGGSDTGGADADATEVGGVQFGGGGADADATEVGGVQFGGGAEDLGEIGLAHEPASEPTSESGPGGGEPAAGDSGTIPLAEEDQKQSSSMGLKIDDEVPAGDAGDSGTGTGTIDLADDAADQPGTGTIDLANESAGLSSGLGEKDPNQGTGVSVFDADEVDDTDPMAQTQVNRPVIGDEEAAIENVGSGSGLLDLTRESDDTSLGAAELLDEIYPGEGTPEGTSLGPGSSGAEPSPIGEATPDTDDSGMGSALGSSGVLEATQAGTEEGAELETLGGATQLDQVDVDPGGEALTEAPIGAGLGDYEPDDPIGSGFGGGMLIGATITLVVGLLVTLAALMDVRLGIMEQMTESANALLIWCGGLLVLNVIGGVVGFLIGKAMASASAAAQPVAAAVE